MLDSEHKLANLQAALTKLSHDDRLAIAFSGGLDSRFLAHAAFLTGLRPLLLHAKGPHITTAESEFASHWAEKNGMELLVLEVDPLAVPEIAANDRKRCYQCKRMLFTELLREADGLPLCDGTQAGDYNTYRPGVAALKELGVISPLADAGLTKSEIRHLSEKTGMQFSEQRAKPCLMTRFAYLLSPDRTTLAAFEKAEERIEMILGSFLKEHSKGSAPDFRLRLLTPDCMELHLTPLPGMEEASEIPQSLIRSLKDAIRQTTGEPVSNIRIMPELSGFFDKD